MERRGQRHHRERLGEALYEEIASIVLGELRDPRVVPATVTEVVLSPDGKSAHVWVTVQGDERAQRDALAGLSSASGYIRHEIAERLSLRRPPELIFQLDNSQQYGTRIEQLLRRIDRRR